MERTTWFTEERIVASAAGAPTEGRTRVGELSRNCLQTRKHAGATPAAYGPGLVSGNASVTFPINDHAAMGRIAWHGKPLGSRGAGYG